MAGLGQLAVSQILAPKKLHNSPNQYSETDGIFIACAAVEKGLGFKIGASVTIGGTPTTITTANMVASIKALAIEGSAYFFGSGEFKGSKAKAQVGVENVTFGYAAGPKNTQRVVEHFMGSYDRWYGNEDFFNQLLSNKKYDWFWFTNNSVHEVLSTENLSYPAEDLGYPMEGTAGQGITGTFGIMQVTKGFKSAEVGIDQNTLTSDDVVLTISDPTTGGTGLTAGTCALVGTKKYTKTNAGNGTLTFAISPSNDCVDWAVHKQDGSALTSGYGTFDTITKVLTLASTMAAGVYTYSVVVVNKTGVKGQLNIEVTVLAS